MIPIANLNRTLRLALLVLFVLLIALAILVVNTHGQTGPGTTRAQVPALSNMPDTPVFSSYKGATIGMTQEVARQKLGAPSEAGARQDFYFFSETESAIVYYDATQKVRAIAINYLGDNAPTPQQVVGVAVAPNEDGALNKLVSYPKLGYWVAYNRTAGAQPLVTVTLQRIIH
jgi:hypothetical protein